MAQIIVRDLEDDVKVRLKARAEQQGRSMEDEARHILREAVKAPSRPLIKLGTRISRRFLRDGLTEDAREMRGQPPRPASFEE